MEPKDSIQITGARIVIETLIEQGVTDVFGYPGGQVLNIYDELYKASERKRARAFPTWPKKTPRFP